MHPIDLEPFVVDEVRMQTRAAAAASSRAANPEPLRLEPLAPIPPQAPQSAVVEHPATEALDRLRAIAEE
eukprot:1331669-Rhodomonas_salina.1